MIMATGIFIAASLQHLPSGSALTRPIAIVLLLSWLAMTALLLLSVRRRGFSFHTSPVVASFAVGTWVAGTAIAARVTMYAAPGSWWLPRVFFFLALVLWLGFIPLWLLGRSLRSFARTSGTA